MPSVASGEVERGCGILLGISHLPLQIVHGRAHIEFLRRCWLNLEGVSGSAGRSDS